MLLQVAYLRSLSWCVQLCWAEEKNWTDIFNAGHPETLIQRERLVRKFRLQGVFSSCSASHPWNHSTKPSRRDTRWQVVMRIIHAVTQKRCTILVLLGPFAANLIECLNSCQSPSKVNTGWLRLLGKEDNDLSLPELVPFRECEAMACVSKGDCYL